MNNLLFDKVQEMSIRKQKNLEFDNQNGLTAFENNYREVQAKVEET
ncbi:MAG: hypothetical protein WCA84_05305 [Ignavibacteriaceae bacterium]